jgi:hypothetical protein
MRNAFNHYSNIHRNPLGYKYYMVIFKINRYSPTSNPENAIPRSKPLLSIKKNKQITLLLC